MTPLDRAVHAAISRALDEANVRVEVLRGMSIEVGLEAFSSALQCDDEGCPHSGTLHVCTNVKLDGEQVLRANELLELATDPNTLEALLRELVWWRDTHGVPGRDGETFSGKPPMLGNSS